jgi:hypothetical protein
MPAFYEDTTPSIETAGTFLPNTAAAFFFSFPDINGDLFDPSDISVYIYDPSSTLVVDGAKTEKLEKGRYAYEWAIPADATKGTYRMDVTYVTSSLSGDVSETFSETFVVTDATSNYLDSQVLAARAMLESFIGKTQAIPVFNETGRMNGQRTQLEFTFPRWNQPAGAKVYVNGTRTTLPFDVDYMRGRISFQYPLSQYDHVTADYNFRWFADDELDTFIMQSIQIFNQYPPHSGYLLWTLPQRYGITIIEQAAVFALRRLMMDLMYQEPAKVYGGAERADKIMGQLETLKQNYEQELNKLYEQKKYGPYVGLTRTIVVPEYTLPGGRARWFRYLFKGA